MRNSRSIMLPLALILLSCVSPSLAIEVELPEPQDALPLLKDLEDPSADVQAAAAYKLAYDDTTVRYPTREGKIVPPADSVPRLVAALKDADPRVRERVADLLPKLTMPQAADPLLAALKDENAGVRAVVARALGNFKQPEVAATLIETLRRDEPSVKAAAARSLGRTAVATAFGPLSELLKSDDASLRQAAADGLRSLGDRRAVEPLLALLAEGGNADATVSSAALALGKLGDERATEPLASLLLDSKNSRNVRRSAAEALGQIKDPRARDILSTFLADSSEISRAAVTSLARARTPEVDEGLLAALQSSDAEVRANAAEALGRSKDAKVIMPLVKALEDTSPTVRAAAVSALGQLRRDGVNFGGIGAPQAIKDMVGRAESREYVAAVRALAAFEDVESLARALHSPHIGVAIQAVVELGELGAKKEAWVREIVAKAEKEGKPVSPEGRESLRLMPRKIIDILNRVLASKREGLSEAAAEALYKMGAPSPYEPPPAAEMAVP